MNHPTKEKALWQQVTELFSVPEFQLGEYWSELYRKDPERLISHLSLYKFAFKMIEVGSKVLELGCQEGIGAHILTEETAEYLGIDENSTSVRGASDRFSTRDNVTFAQGNYMELYGKFDAIVSFDIIDAFSNPQRDLFVQNVIQNLNSQGIFVMSTYRNQGDLKETYRTLKECFYQVLPFQIKGGSVFSANLEGSGEFVFVACDQRRALKC